MKVFIITGVKTSIKHIILSITLLFAAAVESFCGTKRALCIFIGDYPEESGWNKLASQNDKAVVLDMLRKNGFYDENVTCLEEAAATFDAINKALERLAAETQKGDMIYVHFSCHGQQITDQDGDEALRNPADRYDEAIIPYDAGIAYDWHSYRGEHHLLDDILNAYFDTIQRAAGKNGYLLVIYDACHSGDLDRDNKETSLNYRGTFDVFRQPYTGKGRKDAVNRPVTWMSISACKDFQTNYEVEIEGEMYGRLSLAIGRCLKNGITFEALIAALEREYATLPLPKGRMQTLKYEASARQNTQKLFADE